MFGAGMPPTHPLLGRRTSPGSSEFRVLVDAEIVPYLADHKVGGEVVVPAAALLELSFSVARVFLGRATMQVQDFDIWRPLQIAPDGMREISTRFDEASSVVEIRSRRRLGEETWSLHARGRVVLAAGTPAVIEAPLDPATRAGEQRR